jgi:hypothetical protein
MKYLLILPLLLLPTLVYADDVKLTVTQPEAELIWRGLRELPVKDVEIFMNKFHQQVVDQTQPKPVMPPKVEPNASPKP